MYRKRDRSQEQSRFLFLYGRECRARVSWMECGMAVVLCVSVMCLCRRWWLLSYGGGTGNAMVAPSPMPAVDKTKGPASV